MGSSDAQALRSAITAASLGDTVKVAGTCTGVDANDRVLGIDKNLTLMGGFTTTNWLTPDFSANPTTLSALEAGRVITIAGAIDVLLKNLTITEGYSTDSGDDGAGIHINTATVSISNSRVISNTASQNGDGLYTTAPLTITASTFISNTVDQNGGAFMAAMIFWCGIVTLSAIPPNMIMGAG